jgi:hypothetical protein
MSLARDWADLEAWRDINPFASSPMLVTIGGYFRRRGVPAQAGVRCRRGRVGDWVADIRSTKIILLCAMIRAPLNRAWVPHTLNNLMLRGQNGRRQFRIGHRSRYRNRALQEHNSDRDGN